MLKYWLSNVTGSICLVATRLSKWFAKYVASRFSRRLAACCTMPTSKPRDFSGSRSGLPREKRDRLYDCTQVGSFMPRPTLALMCVLDPHLECTSHDIAARGAA